MKKFTKKDLQFRRLKDQMLYKPTASVNGQSFVCRNLEKCTVYLPCFTSTLYIDDCIDCKIYLGPSESSVFIRDCKDCEITVAAQQVRVSGSSSILLYVFSATDLTLEKATNICLAPYNFVYPGIKTDFELAGFDTSLNLGFVVMDFSKEYEDDDPSFKNNKTSNNYYLMTVKNFQGFKMFHDGMMSKHFPDDEYLNNVDSDVLLNEVENAKTNYPIEWPKLFGGGAVDPMAMNSCIRFGENSNMMTFKMGHNAAESKNKFNNFIERKQNNEMVDSTNISVDLKQITNQDSKIYMIIFKYYFFTKYSKMNNECTIY